MSVTRWKLIFEYDGTNFSGWQRQPNTRTVEKDIEKAFSELYQQDVDVVGQGRTDAGVHAKRQVAHVDLPEKFTSHRILHAMKGLLPKDIALLSATPVDPDFHARFSASQRCYSYLVMQWHSPLQRHKVWSCNETLDEHLLYKMADMVAKTDDFVNFCIPDPDKNLTTISEITKSRWIIENELYQYEICANRFLRHMVRRLVGSMVYVAAGRQPLQWFQILLSGEDVHRKGHAAPAHGLYLEQVRY